MKNDIDLFYENIGKRGVKPGLERVKPLLRALGNPESGLKIIHVAGTNGKGSIISFASSVLAEDGCKVGAFTSPYLIRVNEMFQIYNDDNSAEARRAGGDLAGGRPISDEDYDRLSLKIKNLIETDAELSSLELTLFEIQTGLALLYFYEQKCDFIFLEAGLGGRMDATNAPGNTLISVIGKISYDHMDILGDDIKDIISEKLGIIKPGSEVVIAPQDPDIQKIIMEMIAGKYPESIDKVHIALALQSSVEISLLGDHQKENAAAAIKIIECLRIKGYHISEENLKKGLYNAKWPCRLELIHDDPEIYVDAAHNADGAKAMADFFKLKLKAEADLKQVTFIFGVLKDKEYEKMVLHIKPIAKKAYTVTPENERALPAHELTAVLKKLDIESYTCKSIEEAIEKCMEDTGSICVFGSLFFVGYAKKIILQNLTKFSLKIL